MFFFASPSSPFSHTDFSIILHTKEHSHTVWRYRTFYDRANHLPPFLFTSSHFLIMLPTVLSLPAHFFVPFPFVLSVSSLRKWIQNV